MNDVLSYILFGIMVLLGGVPSLLLIVSLPVIIIWKIYRKVKYGEKIF